MCHYILHPNCLFCIYHYRCLPLFLNKFSVCDFVQIHVCCSLALFAAGCFENNRGVSAKIPTQGGNKLLFKNNKNNNISLPKKKQTFKISQMKKLISRLFLGELISISLCSKNDNSTSFPTIYENFDTDQLGVNTLDIPTVLALAVNRKTVTEEVLVKIKSTRPDCVFTTDDQWESCELLLYTLTKFHTSIFIDLQKRVN